MDDHLTEAIMALIDRQAISDVLRRYCRALDRMDRPLAASCWHAGGTDDHAPLYSGDAAGFLDWEWPLHASALAFRHVLTNITIALHGDHAGCESYWSSVMRRARDEGTVDIVSGGRYVDSFERIDGIWAIRHRQVIRDWSRVDPVNAALQPMFKPNNPEVPETIGRRDRDDYSYRILSGASPS